MLLLPVFFVRAGVFLKKRNPNGKVWAKEEKPKIWERKANDVRGVS